jgi:hypothetical protein
MIKFSGTTVTVSAAIPGGNTLAPANWQQLLAWDSDVPVPVELQLTVAIPDAILTFPPAGTVGFCAGARYNNGAGTIWTWDDSADGCVVMKIEMGSGPDARTIYADCRGGRYSLGSQRSVRVSVARWLAAGVAACQVQGAVAPADGSGDYLTYSAAIGAVAAAGDATMPAPPGALWFDFYPEEDGEWEASSTDAAVNWRAQRSVVGAAPLYMPPTSPLPLLGSNGITLVNVGAAASGVYACFWVR